jgi:uncharacterized phage protein (TIGR01671 family)
MRQLKFRAWSYTESKFYTRVLVGDTETDDPCSSVWNDEKKEWVNFDKHCGVIQQFTGLKDKNKKPIYEGDRVRYELDETVYIQTVEWGNNGWEMIDTRLYSTPLIVNLPNFEVVGNIFESRELLNK